MFTRMFARVLSLLGFLIGFTSEVLAQYGVPVYFFSAKGSVKDIECKEPVKNARVKLVDRNGNTQFDAYTDSLGNFTIIHESEGYYPEYQIRIEDPDGADNGIFKDIEEPFDSKKWRSRWDLNTDTIPGDIYLVEYVSGNPCKQQNTVVEPEPIVEPVKEPEPEPVVQPEDTAFVPNEEPVAMPAGQELFTNVNLFPNPNSGRFSVEFTSWNQAATDVYIFTSGGALIYNMSQYAQKGANHFDLELDGLAPGTYYIKLHCFEGDVTKTFIVQ